jgi:hypothetical protein
MAKSANAVVLTPQLEAVVSTDVAVGETLKVEAAAGAGKSTALRLYTERRRSRPTMYLTFTKAEADAKQLEYAALGLEHVVVRTLHARAFEATAHLHHGCVVECSQLSAELIARLTTTSSMDWPAARRDAVCRVLDTFLASDATAPCSVHVDAVGSQAHGLLGAVQVIWCAVCLGTPNVFISHDMYLMGSGEASRVGRRGRTSAAARRRREQDGVVEGDQQRWRVFPGSSSSCERSEHGAGRRRRPLGDGAGCRKRAIGDGHAIAAHPRGTPATSWRDRPAVDASADGYWRPCRSIRSGDGAAAAARRLPQHAHRGDARQQYVPQRPAAARAIYLEHRHRRM